MSHVTLLRERGHGLEMALVVVVPIVFGVITGVMLGKSEPVYVALTLLGIAGGFVAGMEHEGALEGFYRGLLGGLLFGTAILVTNGVLDGEPKAHLPDPEVLLVVITGAFGAGLGALGGWMRLRRERR
jgi:hypothetical protein